MRREAIRGERSTIRVLVAVLLLGCSVAPAASAFAPAYETHNYNKINERAQSDYTPQFNAALTQQGLVNEQRAAEILVTDGPARQYGRNFLGQLCWQHMNGCAGDIRLYDWGSKGYGIVKPILFTARNGATLSGHVWMTVAGPAKRPGVVITNGSVQAPEELYWFAAETLAKAGYVVMTWDPQGQGYSDTFGAGVDRNEGVPSQTGQPFFDGTEDALNFFFSTPANPYMPHKSCSSGTSHADKQIARVADGRNSAYNPFSGSLDTTHVGLVGHSLGAAAVSYVGQLDPRVRAIVAYDNLSDVSAASSSSNLGSTITCPSGSSPRPAHVAITKPALGLSADYNLTPMPYTADPNAATVMGKHAGSLAASKAGADTGQIMIRGGTHYEFSYIPNPSFGATHRGMDMVSWYTAAFMDKELKGDPSADVRLLTTRWRSDHLEGAVDGQSPPDANLYSTYFKSRLDLNLSTGGHFTCEDLRTGCPGQPASDGQPPDYSFLVAAGTPGTATTPGSSTAPAGSPGAPPAATGKPAKPGPPPGGVGPGPRPRCASAGTPHSRIRTLSVGRHGQAIRISGTANAARTRGCPRHLVRVLVAVALLRDRRCHFLSRAGSLGRSVGCRRLSFILASGTARWTLRISARLSPGHYLLYSRAVDSRGSFETKRGSDNFRQLQIRR